MDYDWARETWTLEKESALRGDLRLGLKVSLSEDPGCYRWSLLTDS